ncbi:hypothetical protein M011DRAFT_471031 [Sporormia fimetaria CBS 119925]|uniref:Zn(2)-C6 fungal-type domain-containing protein n=1 Tax=Sporormia fimetaria CBS 119925 TaxID=1340428 RepID=A0A6A6V249_9PLEO|nr:hypothetical protein M011DRAFT_471031 [Sporormia fimetaria CBS 119925]
MSSNYPPPPSDETTQFPLYAPAASTTPLLESPSQPIHPHQQHPHQQHQSPLQYSPQSQSLYPKIETLNDVSHHVLQQQAHQATHALTDQRNQQAPLPHDAQGLPHHHQAIPHLQNQQHQQRPNRLRKACDSCSIRKVKCDESGPPCRACAALEIPCTFDRPSRRRGPPNKHAEAIKNKKRRLDGTEAGSGASTPASPTNAAHALAQLSSHPPQLSAESICPVPTMNALIDDFFTHIHPLCPFPHEPSFREAWERREDYTNPYFLALLASMIACLVASFPRKPRLHIRAQTRDLYPSHLALVDKCREVCAQARGPGYLDSPTLNVYDACASYFLGLAGAYTFNWRQLRLYFGECLTILRALGIQGATTSTASVKGRSDPSKDGDEKSDVIMEQIGRRVFWTLFVGVRTMQQLGSPAPIPIPPSTPSEPHPPLPLETDDTNIYPTHVLPQSAHSIPLLAGFNTNVRIYTAYSLLSTSDLAFGPDVLYSWPTQQKLLAICLSRVKAALDNAPDVLKVHPQDSMQGRFGQRQRPYWPPMPEYMGFREMSEALGVGGEGEGRRERGFEICKANVYASALSVRMGIVERYFALAEKARAREEAEGRSGDVAEGGEVQALGEQSGDANASLDAAVNASTTNPANEPRDPSHEILLSGIEKLIRESGAEVKTGKELEEEMERERENVVRELLVVLGSIDLVNMEPSGDSFIQKIRQIASTLLESSDDPSSTTTTSSSRRGVKGGYVAQQNQHYLQRFLEVLSRLERISPEGGMAGLGGNGMGQGLGMGGPDEDDELRVWADLRECQLRFQEQGGVYGFV